MLRQGLLMAVALVMALGGDYAGTSTQGDPVSQVSPSPGLLLIVSMDESRVDIIDEATWRTLASLNTGKSPHEVRVAPDGRTAYVVSGPTITAIDLASRTIKRTFDLGEFSAHDVRISRDGHRLWAACARQQTVLEIDTESGAVLNRFPTSRDGAWFVEVNPAETKLYTPNLEGTSVSVITRATRAVKVLPLEHQAYGIDVTPDGTYVLVSTVNGRSVAVIDTSTDTVSRTITTAPSNTGRIRITPDGQRVVVAMEKSLAVFEIASGRLIRETALPATPKVMTLSGDGRRAYLSNPADHSATIVDLEEGRVLSTVKTGRRPDGIAWAPQVDRPATQPDRPSAFANINPAWSIDGKRLLFESERSGGSDIYLMDADGGNVKRLTDDPAADTHPRWSPDGTQFVFDSHRGGAGHIYVANVDGSQVRRVTSEDQAKNGAAGRHPDWSPDGRRLVFDSNRDGNVEIYVSSLDGKQQVRLTDSAGDDNHPVWSPDSRRVIFNSSRDGNREMYVVGSEGGTPVNVSRHPARDSGGKWSPDGTRLVLASAREGNLDLFVMSADGSGTATNLTRHADDVYESDWSRDGRMIAFYSNRHGDFEIFTTRADGSELKQLTGVSTNAVQQTPTREARANAGPDDLLPDWHHIVSDLRQRSKLRTNTSGNVLRAFGR